MRRMGEDSTRKEAQQGNVIFINRKNLNHPIWRNPKNEQMHDTYLIVGGYNAV